MLRCNRDEVDIAGLFLKATSQIPRGMVSTYGDIAAALGDTVASRVVGEVLSHNERPIIIPCHRVVYSTGQVGWYSGHGKGHERKVELLSSEGLEVEGGKVKDFERHRFRDFDIPPVLRELREEQDDIASQVRVTDDYGRLHRVAGLDVSYKGERAYGAISIMDWESGEVVEERTVCRRVRFPYIPTYLSYREIPAIRELVKEDRDIIYLIDGQGVLHPRGAGIASHIGVCLDIPTVGAAKSLLCGEVKDPDAERSPVLMNGANKGYVLRQGRKATYVSTGHRVALDTAVVVCSRTLDRGIPSPLRRAHDLASRARREAGD